MTTTTQTTWLGIADVAKMLGVSKSKANAMANTGAVLAYRFGKSYGFAKDQVESWTEAQKIISEERNMSTSQ
jgi:excisionase family DNA binding protein